MFEANSPLPRLRGRRAVTLRRRQGVEGLGVKKPTLVRGLGVGFAPPRGEMMLILQNSAWEAFRHTFSIFRLFLFFFALSLKPAYYRTNRIQRENDSYVRRQTQEF